MKQGFASRVRQVIKQADVILEIADARFAEQTRNNALEKRVAASGKRLVVVLNKSDLIGPSQVRRAKAIVRKEFPCIFVSAKDRSGKSRILEEIGKAKGSGKVTVGIVGYPNTGKSSIINLLRGRKAAPTSRKAGFTRGERIVRINENISLVDTPGVIPVEERDSFSLFLMGAKNPQDLEDKQLGAIQLIDFLSINSPKAIKALYGVSGKDPETVLEKIALKRKRIAKGGVPDLEAAARIVLEDWAKGKLKLKRGN